MAFRGIQNSLALSMSLCWTSLAQTPSQVVQWSGAIPSKPPIRGGSRASIELAADVQSGWHVYGLGQVPGGPTPLRVTVDENDLVQAAGATSGTPPIRHHDSSFNVKTEIYTQRFALHVPVQVKQHPVSGQQEIPVSIRFQACNDRMCLPARTVHLSVPIELAPHP
jgi:hypothetical protein